MSHASKIMNQDTKPVPHFVELNLKLMLRDKKTVPQLWNCIKKYKS